MQNDFLTDAAWGPVGGPGVRYDSEFQQKVVRLAIRLEQEQRDALTPSELEMAAAEVGIEPQFVRHAIAVLSASEALMSQRSRRAATRTQLLRVLATPLVYGTVAFALAGSASVSEFFLIIAPAPVAVILGFLSRRKLVGALSGGLLSLCLAPAAIASHLIQGVDAGSLFVWVTVFGAALGYGGAAIDPDPQEAGEGAVSRQEFVTLLNAMHRSAT